jgi:pectin methylesterase-like acyl-CoA thioesterase
MNRVFRNLAMIGLAAGLTTLAGAAATTLDGTISDSMCGASHAKMIGAHKDAKMTEKDCTLACVKGGGKFVIVSEGKVYNVANQNLAALTQYAGQTVKVTGNVDGDTITFSKVSAKK